MKPAIRLANPDEAPQITALIERAYRGEESKSGWTSEADLLTGPRTSVDEIAAIMREPLARFLVATDGTKDLAACALIRNEEASGYFGMFAVRPNIQGAGLGKAMLDAAERNIKDLWRLNTVYMTVINLRHELIAYYERRGYKRTGERKPFPFDLPSLGATRTDFHLTVLRKSIA
ncbi:MAG: GNAT family N-acetyltransferase [Alphaproteobacteria bacterium]|nr:GNAT family N-acetyltransferase [Alphaproteobacteria bacterium]